MDSELTPEVIRLARLIAASGVAAAVSEPARVEPYRVPEAAKIVGVHQATLYREVRAGNCRAFRIGTGKGAIRIPPEALAEYLKRIEARAAVAVAPQLRAVTA